MRTVPHHVDSAVRAIMQTASTFASATLVIKEYNAQKVIRSQYKVEAYYVGLETSTKQSENHKRRSDII